ncbi:MAG TPA: VWA domain-containing protein [Ktedonobacterales bacterium]
MDEMHTQETPQETPRAIVTLTARQEKALLRPTGSRRHAVFSVRSSVESAPSRTTAAAQAAEAPARRPLTLALTLDRSGSMSGEPLRMAKQVAVSLVDGLNEHDEIAVVVFDDKIDTLQERAAVTPEVKERIRRELARIEARGSTALHEAWLSSCRLITGDQLQETRLARCYLLTDGQANVGETDVETIASQAGDVRDHTGIGTSAFGLGENYNERLLGPWAIAGGGQFHHLRHLGDLADTFLGERDDLRAVVALRTRLEVEMSEGALAETISAYRRSHADRFANRWSLDIGDLVNGEERNVVVRFSFPKENKAYSYTVKARVVWVDGRGEQAGPWQEMTFTQASDAACSDEPRDPQAMRWIGLAHADRTKQRALELEAGHAREQAVWRLRQAIARIGEYAGDDPELREAMRDLEALADAMSARKLTPMESKEAYFAQQTRSRGQKDYRKGQ